MTRAQHVQHLRALAEKAEGDEWFVEHGATEDGLSRIDDGCHHGMFPILGEAHEIEFAAACVKFCREYVLAETDATEPCDCKIGDCKRITRRCLEDRP